jgi:hypothetical protein
MLRLLSPVACCSGHNGSVRLRSSPRQRHHRDAPIAASALCRSVINNSYHYKICQSSNRRLPCPETNNCAGQLGFGDRSIVFRLRLFYPGEAFWSGALQQFKTTGNGAGGVGVVVEHHMVSHASVYNYKATHVACADSPDRAGWRTFASPKVNVLFGKVAFLALIRRNLWEYLQEFFFETTASKKLKDLVQYKKPINPSHTHTHKYREELRRILWNKRFSVRDRKDNLGHF